MLMDTSLAAALSASFTAGQNEEGIQGHGRFVGVYSSVVFQKASSAGSVEAPEF